MKKTYIAPELKEQLVQAEMMIAESMGINRTTTVEGEEALVKGSDDWDIWDEDDELDKE